MTISAHVAAFFAALKALAHSVAERLTPRRVSYTGRIAAFNAVVSVLWRQLASTIEYAYTLGEWVFAPVRVAYRNRGEMIVTKRIPARITERWREGMTNWYRVHNHPWALQEDELAKYERVIEIAGWVAAAA